MPNDQTMLKGNVFWAIADALWESGEDGEMIARNMAVALTKMIRQGMSTNDDTVIISEFNRLRKTDSPLRK